MHQQTNDKKTDVISDRRPNITTDLPYFKTVGNTPLIRVSDHIVAKLETFNPTGSVKDRMIRGIVRKAIERGEINENTIFVEATSGNTGIATAAAGAALGLPVEIFMPKNMSQSRKDMMSAFGATLHLTGHNDFLGAIAGRDEKLKSNSNYWSPNQFSNEMNRVAHLTTTCPEVYAQLMSQYPEFKWDAFVHGSGTGGTISAFCEYRDMNNLDYDIVMTEPTESADTHGIQGIYDGADFLMQREKVHHTWKVPTEAACQRAAKFARETGILVGISSGANLLLAERYVEEKNPSGMVVTILADRGERYMNIFE